MSQEKSEVCYLMQPKKRKTRADLFSMSKAFPIKYNSAKVGILTKHNQARTDNGSSNTN
jgi:hypothetical protein